MSGSRPVEKQIETSLSRICGKNSKIIDLSLNTTKGVIKDSSFAMEDAQKQINTARTDQTMLNST
jgi:hypothetical protein